MVVHSAFCRQPAAGVKEPIRCLRPEGVELHYTLSCKCGLLRCFTPRQHGSVMSKSL